MAKTYIEIEHTGRIMSIKINEFTAFTILADDLQALSEVDTATIGGDVNLTASDLQAASSVSIPVFAEQGQWIKPSPGWPTSRSKREWPWAADSIYNQSIGEDANYVFANMVPPDEWTEDEEHFLSVVSSDPVIESRACNDGLGCWGDNNLLRCNGTTNINFNNSMPDLYFNFPFNYVIPAEAQNNMFTITTPDGNGTRSAGGAARCVAGGPIYSVNHGQSCVRDIKGDMWDTLPSRPDSYCTIQPNGYGGSKVPMGMMLLDDDWADDSPIKHAGSFSLSGWQLYMNRTTQVCESRWPATWCDNWWNEYHNDVTCTRPTGYACYLNVPSSHVYANRMGCLYALPRSMTPTSGMQVYTISTFGPDYFIGPPQPYSIQTAPGLKLFNQMQDYGAYATNTCLAVNHWCRMYMNTTRTGKDNFAARYGYSWNFALVPWGGNVPVPGTEFYRWSEDVRAIIQNLHIINNNTATTIGGPGVRRMRPPAPPFND